MGEIENANAEHATVSENVNTASNADSAVDNIQTALSPTSTTVGRRMRRQDESSTIGPVTTCDEFGEMYNSLLDELAKFSDDNVGLIKQLVEVLNSALSTIDTLCTEEAKQTLKDQSDSKVTAAKAKAAEYKEEKEERLDELVEIVKKALEKIEEANNILIAAFGPVGTVPPVTPAFQIPTDAPTTMGSTAPPAETGPGTDGGSSPPPSETSPGTDGESSPPPSETSPGTDEGSSPPPSETSPGTGESSPPPSETSPGTDVSSSPDNSSTPPTTSTVLGRKRRNFRIIQ